MSLINFDFSTVNAVIFSMDGTLYDNKDFLIKMLFLDKFNIRKIKAERIVRNEARKTDFETSDKFYNFFFSEAAKLSRTNIEKYRQWYFTVFMPNVCRILNTYYPKREGIEELFIQLRRNEIPFAIYSDYTFLKEKLNAIGILNVDNLKLYSAEEMGCLKPLKRGFTTIGTDLLSKNFPSKNILVVGNKDRIDMDFIGAENANFSFIQIENSNNIKLKGKDKFLRVSWDDFTTSFLTYLRQQIATSKF